MRKTLILNTTTYCKECNTEIKQRSSKGGRKKLYCEECRNNTSYAKNKCKCGKEKSAKAKECAQCISSRHHNRTKEIITLRESGKTLKHISNIYNITKERVSQICVSNRIEPFKLICKVCNEMLITYKSNKLYHSKCAKSGNYLNSFKNSLCKCGNNKIKTAELCRKCFINKNITNDEIIRLYNLSYNLTKLAETANITIPSMFMRCKKLGLDTSRNRNRPTA